MSTITALSIKTFSFDRRGRVITSASFLPECKQPTIKATSFDNGWWLSTVPLVVGKVPTFETMLFDDKGMAATDYPVLRYKYKRSAKRGHQLYHNKLAFEFGKYGKRII